MKGIRRQNRFPSQRYLNRLRNPDTYPTTPEGIKAATTLYDIPAVKWDEANLFIVNHPWLVVLDGKIKAYCSNFPLAISIIDDEVRAVLVANIGTDNFSSPTAWVQNAKSGKIYPFEGGSVRYNYNGE